MLGWALKKGFQTATGTHDATQIEENTHFEAPDTPAPVFAARAIKNALWGGAAEPGQAPQERAPVLQDEKRGAEPKAPIDNATPDDLQSPSKPTSILLTPGTGTARRKRVSFGHDVKAGNNIDSSPSAAPAARSSNRPRRRTHLQQALENARSIKSDDVKTKTEPATEATKAIPTNERDSDGEWEDDFCHHDVTVDLNEPHSESGKYWKSEFNRYREEARFDIEKLVKYKALAKSFASKKDAEASGLSQKLKEEHRKVLDLEKRITDMDSQIADRKKRGTDRDNATSAKDLAKQASLVTQYRDQVKELETLLKEAKAEATANRNNRHRIHTSPRTEQTLLEVNRELRKARSELREMDKLRDEVKTLESDLASAEEEVIQLKGKASESVSDSSQVRKLERALREAKHEIRQRDSKVARLERDYESLKQDAKTRHSEAMQVLQEKNAKIAALEKTIKNLEAPKPPRSRPDSLDAAMAENSRLSRHLKSGIESLGRSLQDKDSKPRRLRKRAASVEDLTLDMTQRSLLTEKNEQSLSNTLRDTRRTPRDFDNDWRTALPDTQGKTGNDRKGRRRERLREEELIIEDSDIEPPRPLAKPNTSTSPPTAMFGALTDKKNEASSRERSRHYHAHYGQPSALEEPTTLGQASAHTASTEIVPQARTKSNTSYQFPIEDETPKIDLMQDKFTRLGAMASERTNTANNSRGTLSADRKAAARARLEQKKLDRLKSKDTSRDKENVRPQRTREIGNHA
ncbi:spindle pole body formation-associated protein-domain-containing protein [Xylariomycetidae sp. FL2044]|nr:spindle pole body formation-associated protein-domain-containing protein [Xylariomycetidae sp. FL2044]